MDGNDRPARGPWGLDQLIDVTELADYLGVPVTTIYDWRANGKGPPAYRFGKRIKFAVSDVREITYRSVGRGRTEARARYRDWDGKTRLVQATADGERDLDIEGHLSLQ